MCVRGPEGKQKRGAMLLCCDAPEKFPCFGPGARHNTRHEEAVQLSSGFGVRHAAGAATTWSTAGLHLRQPACGKSPPCGCCFAVTQNGLSQVFDVFVITQETDCKAAVPLTSLVCLCSFANTLSPPPS